MVRDFALMKQIIAFEIRAEFLQITIVYVSTNLNNDFFWRQKVPFSLHWSLSVFFGLLLVLKDTDMRLVESIDDVLCVNFSKHILLESFQNRHDLFLYFEFNVEHSAELDKVD